MNTIIIAIALLAGSNDTNSTQPEIATRPAISQEQMDSIINDRNAWNHDLQLQSDNVFTAERIA